MKDGKNSLKPATHRMSGRAWIGVMVVLGFLSSRIVSGAVWDSVLPLARGVADPKMDIGYRLKRMQDMFLLLDHMDWTTKVVYVKADASGQENGTSWGKAFHS